MITMNTLIETNCQMMNMREQSEWGAGKMAVNQTIYNENNSRYIYSSGFSAAVWPCVCAVHLNALLE